VATHAVCELQPFRNNAEHSLGHERLKHVFRRRERHPSVECGPGLEDGSGGEVGVPKLRRAISQAAVGRAAREGPGFLAVGSFIKKSTETAWTCCVRRTPGPCGLYPLAVRFSPPGSQQTCGNRNQAFKRSNAPAGGVTPAEQIRWLNRLVVAIRGRDAQRVRFCPAIKCAADQHTLADGDRGESADTPRSTTYRDRVR
jgi:hypothetical protein